MNGHNHEYSEQQEGKWVCTCGNVAPTVLFVQQKNAEIARRILADHLGESLFIPKE